MNLLSFALLGMVILYLIFSIMYIYKNKKSNKGCNGSCGLCTKNCR